ncbi:MAG: hypothetical protein M0R02_07005 [Bacteroidales bacterium]|nr:hypothetical protein [Bacteroidales bacterium]
MEKQKTIQKVMEIFSTYGVRTVSIDFISQSIPLPKRKLLEIAKNKEELIQHIFQYRFERSRILFETELQKNTITNAIDELIYISVHMNANAQTEFKPMLDFEFKKYYPDLYSQYQQKCTLLFTQGIQNNIERGKKEGIYKKELDAQNIAQMHSKKIDEIHALYEKELHNETNSLQALFFETLIHHIALITNAQGQEYFDNKKHILQQLVTKQ